MGGQAALKLCFEWDTATRRCHPCTRIDGMSTSSGKPTPVLRLQHSPRTTTPMVLTLRQAEAVVLHARVGQWRRRLCCCCLHIHHSIAEFHL